MLRSHALVTLGPVTSSWGLKTWRLILRTDEILAWQCGFKDGLKLALMLELGIGHDPGDFKTFEEARAALVKHSVRRFPLSEIKRLIVRSSSLRHKIEILSTDGSTEQYGIYHRHLLDHYRTVLRRTYPDRYREEDFPTTRWAKIAKY